MARVECYFDCSSPWTYLAFHNLSKMARELEIEVDWRPILVGGIFNTVNPSVYAARQTPVVPKAKYMRKDLQDWARHAGLEINWPSVFPVNSVKAMRSCIIAGIEGRLEAYARACFEAYWRDGLDISQGDILARIAATAGLDGAAVAEATRMEMAKQILRENTDAVIARGGFGSPTIFVDGGDMYFGNDRLPLVRAALQRAV